MAKVMCQFQDFAILEVSYEPLKVFDLVFKHLHCHLYHNNYLSTKFQVRIHNFRGWLKLSAGHITLPAAKKAPSRENFSKILPEYGAHVQGLAAVKWTEIFLCG